jgi:hypothetical protein
MKRGPRNTGGARRSSGGFGRKSVSTIVSDTERMKNTPIRVCAETFFVSWRTESRRINSFPNFLSLNQYFRKCFKLVFRKNVIPVTLTTGIIFLLFWVWGILYRWSVCAPTAYEVVRDCRIFDKHWFRLLYRRRMNTSIWTAFLYLVKLHFRLCLDWPVDGLT